MSARRVERLAWLLSPTGSGTIRSEDDLVDAFALASRCWHVAAAIHARLVPKLRRAQRAHPLMLRLADFSRGLTAYGRVQTRLALRVAEAYAQEEIAFVFLKSAATRFLAYDDPAHRVGYDLDLGVAHRDLQRADAVARTLGFAPAVWDGPAQRYFAASPAVVADAEQDHYELSFRVRDQIVRGLDDQTAAAIRREPLNARLWYESDGQLRCYVALDVHFAASMEIPLDEALAAARTVRYRGHRLPIPPLGWIVFHLIFKLYWEGVNAYGKGAYQFADLCRLVPRLTGREIARLERLLEPMHLRAGAYYTLSRLPSLGVRLPPRLVRFVERASYAPAGTDPVTENDLGDVWAKAWGRR